MQEPEEGQPIGAGGGTLARRISMADGLRMVGISKLVLHAWERRYERHLADRTETGRRYFTPRQVEHLKLLKQCTDAGHRIGSIIDLPPEELRALVRGHAKLVALTPLLEAIQQMDLPRMRRLLAEHLQEEGPADFAKNTIAPLMREVGRQWSDGALSIAAEHMASAEVRGMLSGCLAALPAEPMAVRAVVTTMEGDQHEIGSMLITLLARQVGLGALYLGPDLPASEIAQAARTWNARIVCLSSLYGRLRVLEPRLADLRDRLADTTELWVGGPGFAELKQMKGIRYFADVASFEEAARDLVARYTASTADG
ncbi:B12-binding domain-containing protein [Rhizobium sp. CSW-27]|uniref:MerR family transcriptional regulator n=1 Tax=Rhizobium sp. CSW-27 TaxID=2839985 RepID=UPI001C026DF7|nr:cobalamin-dependent protein [Rhizobium sp. CSW-27]